MEIVNLGGNERRQTKERFLMGDIRLEYGSTDRPYGSSSGTRLSISLKRWRSNEKKEAPGKLIIEIAEIHKMVEALTEELDICCHLLREHRLLDKLVEAKRNRTIAEPFE